MEKIVIKKLLLQIFIVSILLLIPFLIVNKVFGPNTIRYIVAEVPSNTSKDIILVASSDGRNPQSSRYIVASTNGYVLFEKNGFINPYRINENSLLLFYIDPTLTDRRVYLLNTETYKVSEISEGISLPKDPQTSMIGDFENSSDNFCFYYKEYSYKVSCFGFSTLTNKLSVIDTKEINSLLKNIKSNKYFLHDELSHFNVEKKKSEYVLGYSQDMSRIQPENILSFIIENNKTSIIGSTLANHKIDNENMVDVYSNLYQGSILENNYPIGLFSSVRSMGVSYSLSSTFYEEYDPQCNGDYPSCPYISNPVIGSQYIEYKGIKYMEWLSTYNFNKIEGGILGNHTIYVKINGDLFLIEIATKKIYKLNIKASFSNNRFFGIAYY